MTDNDKARCVFVSVGVGERYEPYVRRLRESVAKNWSGPTLFYEGVWPPGSPTHHQVNYAFKAYAIKEAIRRGYTCLVYSDACVVAQKPMDPLFDHVIQDGYLLIADKHRLRTWASDAILDWIDTDRADVPESAESAAGGFIGMDLLHPVGNKLYTLWQAAFDRGLSKVLWADGRRTSERASSVMADTGEFISSDPDVKGSMGDEAVLGAIMLKHGYIGQPGNNPWCSMHKDAGICLSTGYDPL